MVKSPELFQDRQWPCNTLKFIKTKTNTTTGKMVLKLVTIQRLRKNGLISRTLRIFEFRNCTRKCMSVGDVFQVVKLVFNFDDSSGVSHDQGFNKRRDSRSTNIVNFFHPVKWSYGKKPLGKLRDDEIDAFNNDSRSSRFSDTGVQARSKYILLKRAISKTFIFVFYAIITVSITQQRQ
jgi:hypothetical protein